MKLSRNKIDKLLKIRNQSRKNKNLRAKTMFNDLLQAKQVQVQAKQHAKTMNMKPAYVNLRLKTLKNNKLGGNSSQNGGTAVAFKVKLFLADKEEALQVAPGAQGKVDIAALLKAIEAVKAITKTTQEAIVVMSDPFGFNVPAVDDFNTELYVITYNNEIIHNDKCDAFTEKFNKVMNNSENKTLTLFVRTKQFHFFYRVLYGNLFFLIDVQYIRNLVSYLAIIPEYQELVQARDRKVRLADRTPEEEATEKLLKESWKLDEQEYTGSTEAEGEEEQEGGAAKLVVRKGEWSKARWLGKSKNLAGEDSKFVGFPNPNYRPVLYTGDGKGINEKYFNIKRNNLRKLDYEKLKDVSGTKFISAADIDTKIGNTFHILLHASDKVTFNNTEDHYENTFTGNRNKNIANVEAPGILKQKLDDATEIYEKAKKELYDQNRVNESLQAKYNRALAEQNEDTTKNPQLINNVNDAKKELNKNKPKIENATSDLNKATETVDKAQKAYNNAKSNKPTGFLPSVSDTTIYPFGLQIKNMGGKALTTVTLGVGKTRQANREDNYSDIINTSGKSDFYPKYEEAREEARKKLYTFINTIASDANKEIPEFKKALNLKYYFNYICFCFLQEVDAPYVSYLEKVNILRKINYFYQEMAVEDFKKSQEDKPAEGYVGKFFRKFRVLQLPENITTSTNADFKNAKGYIKNMIDAYASARIKLTEADAEEETPEGYLFTIGDSIGHGEFVKQYVKYIETKMSELRGMKIEEGATKISSKLGNRSVTFDKIYDATILDSKVPKYELFTTMKNVIDKAQGMGQSLVELYFSAQSTKGKAPELKTLMAWLSDSDDIIGIIRDINASMTNTILPLAISYGNNIVKRKEAEKSELAQKTAGDLKKNIDLILENLKDISEEPYVAEMIKNQATGAAEDTEKNNIDNKLGIVLKSIEQVKPELTKQLNDKDKKKEIRDFLTKADAFISKFKNVGTAIVPVPPIVSPPAIGQGQNPLGQNPIDKGSLGTGEEEESPEYDYADSQGKDEYVVLADDQGGGGVKAKDVDTTNVITIKPLIDATESLKKVLYTSKQDRDKETTDKVVNEILEISNEIFDKAKEIKELSAGDIIDITATDTDATDASASAGTAQTGGVGLNEDEIAADIKALYEEDTATKKANGGLIFKLKNKIDEGKTPFTDLKKPTPEELTRKKFYVPEVVTAIRTTELAAKALDAIRKNATIDLKTLNPTAKGATTPIDNKAIQDKIDKAKKLLEENTKKQDEELPTDENGKDTIENREYVAAEKKLNGLKGTPGTGLDALKTELQKFTEDKGTKESKISGAFTDVLAKAKEVLKLKPDDTNAKLVDEISKTLNSSSTDQKKLKDSINELVSNSKSSSASAQPVQSSEQSALNAAITAFEGTKSNEVDEAKGEIAKLDLQIKDVNEKIEKSKSEIEAAEEDFKKKEAALEAVKTQAFTNKQIKDREDKININVNPKTGLVDTDTSKNTQPLKVFIQNQEEELKKNEKLETENKAKPNYLTGANKLFDAAKKLKGLIDSIAGKSAVEKKAAEDAAKEKESAVKESAAKESAAAALMPGAAIDPAALAELQRQIDELKAKVAMNEEQKGLADERADVAAIQAIMAGEDALAHKIKFLVDIPKWQQFKVIGSTDNSVEEFTQGMATDTARVNLGEGAKALFALKTKMENEAKAMHDLTTKLKVESEKLKANIKDVVQLQIVKQLLTQLKDLQGTVLEEKKKDDKEIQKVQEKQDKVTADAITPKTSEVEVQKIQVPLDAFIKNTDKDQAAPLQQALEKAIGEATLANTKDANPNPDITKKIEEANKAMADKSSPAAAAVNGPENKLTSSPNDIPGGRKLQKGGRNKHRGGYKQRGGVDENTAAIEAEAASTQGSTSSTTEEEVSPSSTVEVSPDSPTVSSDPLPVSTGTAPGSTELSQTPPEGSQNLLPEQVSPDTPPEGSPNPLPPGSTSSPPEQVSPSSTTTGNTNPTTEKQVTQSATAEQIGETTETLVAALAEFDKVVASAEETINAAAAESGQSATVPESEGANASATVPASEGANASAENPVIEGAPTNEKVNPNGPASVSTEPASRAEQGQVKGEQVKEQGNTSNSVIKPPPQETEEEIQEDNVLVQGQGQEKPGQGQGQRGGEIKKNPKLDKTNQNLRPTGYAVYGRNDEKKEYYFYKKKCNEDHANHYVTCNKDLPAYIVNKYRNFYKVEESNFKNVGDISSFDDYYKTQGYQDIDATFNEDDKSLNEIFFKPRSSESRSSSELKDKYKPEKLTEGSIADKIFNPVGAIFDAIDVRSSNNERKKAAKAEIAEEAKTKAAAAPHSSGGSKKHKKTKRKRSRNKKNKKHSKKRKH